MAIWLNIAGTGDGIQYTRLSDGVFQRYIWHGHSFWPSYELQDWQEVNYEWLTPAIYGADTTFNLTGFQSGNEVVMYVNEIHWDSGYSGQWVMEFRDWTGTVLFTADHSQTFPAPPSGYTAGVYAWIGIGVRPEPWPEIYYNGNYTAVTTGIVSNTTNFTVYNLDTATLVRYPGKEGYMWVEDDYLWYICYMGTKVKILPQPGGETSTSTPGAVWISDSDYRIHWVDENGIHRKSKLGDKYWTEGWQGGTNFVGTSKTGYIYARDDPGWTELHYVAYDGYLVRHGPGYVYSGDFQ